MLNRKLPLRFVAVESTDTAPVAVICSSTTMHRSGPAMRPAPETVRRTRPAVSAAAGRLPYAARDGAGLSGRLRGAVLKN